MPAQSGPVACHPYASKGVAALGCGRFSGLPRGPDGATLDGDTRRPPKAFRPQLVMMSLDTSTRMAPSAKLHYTVLVLLLSSFFISSYHS